MIKWIAAVMILAVMFFVYCLCVASSRSRDWEMEDEEQARYLASLSKKTS